MGHFPRGYRDRTSRPRIAGHAGGIFADPVDLSGLFVVAAARYLEHTGDLAFARALEPAMDRAIAWLMRQDRDGDGLVESHFPADWMDSILKVGKIFNLNVNYLAGLRACAGIKRSLGAAEEAERWRRLAAVTFERLHAVFWNGEYFSDWVHRGRRGGFASDGDGLAMFWDVATPAQARRILEFVADHGLQRTLISPWLGTLLALHKERYEGRAGALEDLAVFADWYVRGNRRQRSLHP